MRTGLLYIVLVGIPVLALVGVIQIGERITPPPFLGGTWRFTDETAVTADASASASDGCTPLQEKGGLPDMEIIQSGIVMDLVFHGPPHARTDARLRGDVLRATWPAGGSRCASGWVVEARIDGPAGSERLTGTWTPIDCDACSPLPFMATRIASPATPTR